MQRLLLCVLLVSCRPPPVSAPPKPAVSEQDELAALLLSIPAECTAAAPLEAVSCPAADPLTSEACVVERFDTRSGRLTDRLVYEGEDLVRQEQVVSAHTKAATTLRYDAAHRLTEKTACFAAGAGEPSWSPSWRPPMAVYDAPMNEQTRTVIQYVGDSRSPRFAQTDSSTGADEGYRMKLCYAYDEAGRRARRFQTFRSQVPAALQVQSRTYRWTETKLASIETKNVSLQGRAVAARSGYRVDFAYDPAGRLSEYQSAGATTRFKYDERGRFIAYAGITFDWDDAGRLRGFHPGDDALDGTFEWDSSGRIASATFKNGDGFRVTYGERCKAGFSPPPVTPSVEGYLFYEGKDEL
ncbi:MAG: hypothetical protein Q8L48_31155 [Archangium sp.]|nr:hypothetical protein [Archangium sp.]